MSRASSRRAKFPKRVRSQGTPQRWSFLTRISSAIPKHRLLDQVLCTVVFIGVAIELVLSHQDGNKEWFVRECVVSLTLAVVAWVTMPFATGTEPTGAFHRALSILFLATIAVFLLTCVSTIDVSDDQLEWAKLFVWVGSALLLVFVFGPLSTFCYCVWTYRQFVGGNEEVARAVK